jgi:hypothetical protein
MGRDVAGQMIVRGTVGQQVALACLWTMQSIKIFPLRACSSWPIKRAPESRGPLRAVPAFEISHIASYLSLEGLR